MFGPLLSFLLVTGSCLASAKLTVTSPKLSLLSDKGSVLKAEALQIGVSQLETITAGPTDTLKLSFTVTDDENSELAGVQPHQAFLRFWEEGGEEGIQPVKVASNGKGKFDLSVLRPPPSIPATSETSILNVDLILGSYTIASSTLQLFKLRLPASLPVVPHPEEVFYHPQPEIYHTFKGEQRTPRTEISGVFGVIALAPWVLLLALLSQLPIHIKPSLATAPFIVLLAAFEGLIVWYWVDLRLGQVLTYGAILSVFTAAAGKRALGSL